MSIRVALLILFVLFFSGYAWKNWFVSTCASVLLLAVVLHPDFPTSVGGIQGLNPWNFLILNVTLAWLSQRGKEGYLWDFPSGIGMLLCGYILLIFVAAVRFMPQATSEFPIGTIISEDIINTTKWVLPGIILFDACRTRRRVYIALGVILTLYLLLAVQVVRWMPLGAAMSSGDELSRLGARFIQNEIGYNRVTLSNMLAGASWAILVSVILVRTHWQRLIVLASAGLTTLGQALTGGRTGYVTWAFVGLLLSLIRWRRLLPLIPVVILAVGIAFPAVWDRMLQGIGEKSGNVARANEYEMTSGRNIAWPVVIDKIQESPLIGYGKEAMISTGLSGMLMSRYGESFPHPHQAYLEILLDNGLLGFLIVVPFYLAVFWRSFKLVLVREDPLVCAVGATAFCLIAALLTGAMGGQTFYPREGSVGMWAAIGLMLRVSVEWSRSVEYGEPMFGEAEEVSYEDDPRLREPVMV
jgi:O-antigen ligase